MTALLQTSNGDLDITLGKLSLVSGPTEKAQKISNRLQLFATEWFLDQRVGVPYYDVVLVKDPDLLVVQRLLQHVVESVPGITEASVETIFDNAGRELTYSWVATDDEGQQIEGGAGPLFAPRP